MSEWISVEEKLPSKDGIYRVMVEYYALRSCMETVAVFHGGKWVSFWGWWQVTHWIDPSAEKGE